MMSQKEKARNYDADQTVKEFNEKFPVGARVRWRTVSKDGFPYREYTVRYPATNHCGTAVAWFRERSAMVSVAPEFVDYGAK